MSAAARRGSVAARATGVARSLVTYYGPVWRRRRLAAFYGRFLGPGDLAFDVGAHVGNRVHTFRGLGARVVAVEPQPDLVRVLHVLHGRDPGVRIEACGLAERQGTGRLHLSSRTPTVSTLTGAWIDEVRGDRGFAGVTWDATAAVRLTTLDALVARHGEPAFCKIDVEGSELAVLGGLGRPLSALSFECLPVAVDRAVACVERLEALGDYRFRHSPGESHRWSWPWLTGPRAVAALRALPPAAGSGDVYAVRSDTLGGLPPAA